MKRGLLVFVFLLLVFVLVIVLFRPSLWGPGQFLSGEDNWICQNGEWVKHGNPSAPKPTIPCK